jgi:hypothetical protein
MSSVALTSLLLWGCSGSQDGAGGTTASELRGGAGSVGTSFNIKGDILIADQFNNRVIETDPRGTIVWSFGLGPSDVSARSIIGVNDVQRVGPLTLMAGTGAPPGSEPLCANGCPDNRVMLVNPRGKVVWQYGKFGVTGAGPDELNTPVQSTWLPGGHVLISDQGNQRVIEVDRAKEIVWQYGTTGVAGSGPGQLDNPNSAELLENGHILISDENNDRAIEVTHDPQPAIVATFTAGGTVSGVAFASRLADGHTLITDSNHSRIVEVDAADRVVWQFLTNDPAGNTAPLPTRAVRLRDGDTLISDQFNHRVIRVDRTGGLVASYGNLNQPGYGTQNASQGLNGPYDAKVVGDFTGLTPPFGKDFE